jgi:hypothetical protein
LWWPLLRLIDRYVVMGRPCFAPTASCRSLDLDGFGERPRPSAAAFASAEPKHSAGDGIYWAITTMTTVGYGDLSPETNTGKVIAVGVMVVGIGFIALLTGRSHSASSHPLSNRSKRKLSS